jgi:transposase
MELLHPKCAGLDVHKDIVVACIRIQQDRQAAFQVKTFGTTTQALLQLSSWLGENEVTHVAMEATGVYWKPVWHVLDGTFELVLANAMHIKSVPGRKTDVNDATWISEILAHGWIRSSFVAHRNSRYADTDADAQTVSARASAACAADPEDAGGRQS